MNDEQACSICGDDLDEKVICSKCLAEDKKWKKRHEAYAERGWKQETCGSCRGYGVVSDYSGGDFNGPMDCDHCVGGMVWRTPSGKHCALWPGGPFVC